MKLCLLTMVLCLILGGCHASGPVQADIFAMDTVMNLKVWSTDQADGEAAVAAVRGILTDLERTWSAIDETSSLSALNRGEDPQWTAEEAAFLEELEHLSDLTGGSFDPQLGSLSKAWGFYDDVHQVPTQDTITAALADAGYDTGAALKGYAGKLAVSALNQRNVACALLNLGGNIQTYGTKQDGSDWKIGIQDPRGSGTIGIVSVTGTMAVVTSGDYQRYFELDGVRYHHILDPQTGHPARSGLISVTVIQQDGLLADVLSTALFVKGLEESIRFWQEDHNFEAVFILDTGEIYATEGVQLSGCTYEVIRSEK